MILACDIGTSSLKLGVIDRAGNLLAFGREPLGRPSAAAWWRAFLRSLGRVPGALRRGLRAVCVSGNAPTLVPVDKRGRPVSAPLMWYKPGAAAASDFPLPSCFLPKVRHFARERPRQYDRTDCFLPCGEYLTFVLTGNKSAFIPHDGFAPYYWQEESIARFRLDRRKFPPFRIIGERAGRVNERVSRRTGIPEGTPVFGGGADFLMAILGSGASDVGRANDRGGTSEAVNYCNREPVGSPLLRPVPGFRAGTWNLGGFVPDAGRFHAWLKDKLVGRRGTYEEFAALSGEIVPGASTLRFAPPSLRRVELSGLLPLASAFLGITAETQKGEYARAFLEYIGFSIRRIIEELEDKGLAVQSLHSTGGLAKCAPLCRMKASVTGKTVRVPAIEDSELLGNAIVALSGLGDYGPMEEAAGRLVRFKAEFFPDKALSGLYDDLYDDFRARSGPNQGEARAPDRWP